MKCILVLLLAFCSALSAQDTLKRPFQDPGYEKYVEGERAKTPEERKKAFNDALSAYLQLQLEHPSGYYLYDIANCYYQLGEYGLAILYYNRAERKLPRDPKIQYNLQQALRKAGLPQNQSIAFSDYVFFFHKKLSFYERELLVLAFALFTFVFGSLAIWLKQKAFRTLSYFSLAITLLFSASLLYSHYFSHLEAVVIRPAGLSLGAGKEYGTKQPLLVGQKVQVEEVVEHGDWLKIRLPTGEEGYVSKENARII
jgi:tetratricopeptide (TPR) repeat protein